MVQVKRLRIIPEDPLGRPLNSNIPINQYLLDEKLVLAAKCIFHDYWNLGYSNCKLDLISKNKKLRVTKETTKDEIINFLGEPESTETQRQLTILHYFFDKFYYEIDFLGDGKISYIHGYLKG